MRTTIDIDDEILLTVKEIAHQRSQTAGTVVSALLRDALRPRRFKPRFRNGIPLIPRKSGGPAVTPGLVNRLRDEDE